MERVRTEVNRVPEVNRVQAAPGQVWDAGSVELATWIITEANQQATEIRHEARDDAAAARADAKQEAARLVQQAADQAAATLAAAELQAAKVRAEIMRLSADLGGVATSFTESLLTQAPPATKIVDKLIAAPAAAPTVKPKAEPAAVPVLNPAGKPAATPVATTATEPAARPNARPAAKPATRPTTRSASAPATKPGISPRRVKPETRATDKPKNRQVSAAHKVTAAFVTLSLIGAATGATELALHGPAFFLFRANGAGASVTGPVEDQGPGQPDAPGAHHDANVIKAKGKHAK